MNMKKWSALLLALVMLAGAVAGCSGPEVSDTGNQDTATPSTSGGDAAAPEAATPSTSGEKVELEYMSHKSEAEAIEAWDRIIERFGEEYPNITVTHTPSADFKTVLLTRVAANEMPDIFSFSSSNTYEVMYEDGLIANLDGQAFYGNIQTDAVELAKYNGANYRVPITMSAYGLYYRTDIFEEHGIPEPTSYADIQSAADALLAAGITPFSNEDKDIGVVGQRMERMLGIINNDVDTEFRQIAAGELAAKDSPSLNKYAEVILHMTEFGPADSLGIDHDSAIANIVSGECAMLMSGTWSLASMKTGDPDIQVKFIPFFNPTGGETNIPINIDTAYSIATSCKNMDEALLFLEFMTRTDIAQLYADMEGTPNMVEGVTLDIPEFKDVLDLMDAGGMFPTPTCIWPAGLREDMRNPAQQMIMDKDVDAFLDAVEVFIVDKYAE